MVEPFVVEGLERPPRLPRPRARVCGAANSEFVCDTVVASRCVTRT